MWELFWYATFFLAFAVQILFWSLIFQKLARYRPNNKEETSTRFPKVSVVVCVHNEAAHLPKLLDNLLNQDYPEYELILVNDASTDNSRDIILDFQKKYPILHLLEILSKTKPGKKEALTKGILAAQHEILLLTDADCFPSTSLWIKTMVATFPLQEGIVLGFAPYQSENSFLNKWIRFETIYTAMQYLSFALAGYPYMGVGRNLAYSKSLFLQNNGFKGHTHLASGDDDLFINKTANKHNVRININPKAFVFSYAMSNWKRYYNQKNRHLTTATSYQFRHQFLLGLLAWSHLWVFLGGILLLLAYPTSLLIVCILFLVRMVIVGFYYWRILKKLEQGDLWKWIPLLDFLYCVYYLIFVPALINTGNRSTWT